MADLIGGAAVGVIFSELYKAVENLKEKTKKFPTHLKAIKATVDSLKPLIDQMEEQNKELNLSNEETEKLKNIISNGVKLVGDCSKNPKWYRKASYTDKITDLDEALKRQLEILKAQGLRDGKETLIRVTEIKKLINQLQASLLQASWLLLVLIIFLILVSRVMFSVPGGVREQQLATSSGSVPDGCIILSRPARLQLGYFVVWLFGKLLVYAVYGVFVCMAIGIVCACVEAIQDQYRLGFSGLKLPEWDELNVFNKPMYTRKLIALDASLRTLLSVLTAHIASYLRARVINVATVMNHIDANIAAQNQNVNQIRGWSAIPEPPPFTVGLDVHVEELKLELLKDEASMLVVTGLGGCGKTTLAQKVCEDQKVKEKFRSNIFFVIVSKNTNCLVVQELCQKTGSLVPALQDEAIAFNWLQEFLKKTGQDPLLLVLDDVWLGSESLLDKFGELKRPNYNILVTSRFQFPRFGRAYPLGTLEQGDAMTLFRHAASRPDRSSYIPEDLAKQIVKLCKGVPLAIKTIGKSVCEQPTEIWQKRVAELSSSILVSENYLLDCLKSSLDALDERMPIIKECFIDLASFPEDRSIPAVALIDMWAELYGLDEVFGSIVNIHELTNRNLVNLVTRNGKMEMDGYYSEHFVTQHDMLRNLAIHQTGQDEIGQEKRLIIEICGDNLPKGWTEQKNKPKKTRLLSISTDGLSSAKWQDMHLPKAEVLVLNFQTENYVLPKFVKKMSKLKVLIVTNYGVLQADLSNFKLLGSLANLKRIRLESISIPSISKNFMQLKSLQKISLFMCSIGQAFSNSSIQILEAFPNLVELNIDYCNDLVELPAKLCDLIRLKKLSITNCHKLSALPEEIGKLVNLEVLRLRSCTELERLPGSIKNLKKLGFLDIYKCLSIMELPEEMGEMSGLRKINMGQCSRLQELPVSVLNLGELRKVICDEDTENLWGPFKSCLDINITVAKEQHNLNWLYKP